MISAIPVVVGLWLALLASVGGFCLATWARSRARPALAFTVAAATLLAASFLVMG